MAKQNRYPGIRPFTQDDNRLFFGRSESIKRINRMFKLERLMVLFGKSGLGKTSLVQAGAIPILHQEDMKDGIEDLRFETVRFGAYDPDKDDAKKIGMRPVAHIRKAIEMEKGKEIPFPVSQLFDHIQDDGSPWLAAKDKQLSGDHRTIVLIIDQSEELFTWPKQDIDDVKYALRDLLNQNLPDHLEDQLREAASKGRVDYGQLMSPPELKSMMIIRSDRLDELDQMTDVLPDIYNKRFELPPLDRSSAQEAIEEPASLDGDFSTPKFSFSEDGMTMILDFLCNKHTEKDGSAGRKHKQERVEGFQLQMICQHVEKIVQQRAKAGESDIVMGVDDIGDLQEVTKSYYQDVLAGIKDPKERDQVQILVEEKLIYDAGTASRRLSEFDGVIMTAYAVKQESLSYLHERRLLRRMSLSEGGYMYEISHDSLMAPILGIKKIRLAALELQRKKEKAEKDAELAAAAAAAEEKRKDDERAEEKRKRTALFAVISSVLLLFAIGGMAFAFVQSGKADEQREKALEQTAIADSLRSRAVELRTVAEERADREEALRVKSDSLGAVANQKSRDLSRELDRNQELVQKYARASQERDIALKSLHMNQMLENFKWMSELSAFDAQRYATFRFEDWRENDMNLDRANFYDSLTIDEIDKAEFVHRLSTDPKVLEIPERLFLLHELIANNGDALDTAVVYTNFSKGRTSIERQTYNLGGSERATSLAMVRQAATTKYLIGLDSGIVVVVDENFERIDTLENPHLPDHRYSEGRATVRTIEVSPNGKFIATGGADGSVHLYRNNEEFSPIQVLKYGNDWVRDIAFTQGGEYMMVGGDILKMKEYQISLNSDVRDKQMRGEPKRTERSRSQTYKVVEGDSLEGFSNYIYAVCYSATGRMVAGGDEVGEVIVWQKSGSAWNPINLPAIPSLTNVGKIFWKGEKVFVTDRYGNIWGIEPGEEDEWLPVSQEIVDETRFTSIIGTEISRDRGRIVRFDGESQLAYLMLDQGNQPASEIGALDTPPFDIISDLSKNEVIVMGRSSMTRFKAVSKPIMHKYDDLLVGILPEMNASQKIRLGQLSSQDIEKMSSSEKFSVLEELENEFTFERFSEGFANNYASLTVSYLNDQVSSSGSDFDPVTSEFLEQTLQRFDFEVRQNRGIQNSPLFKSSLVNQEPSQLTQWLYWAMKWRDEPKQNQARRKYFASLSYHFFPVKAWEYVLLGSESGENFVVSASEDIGSDVNSIAFHPLTGEIMVTTDVGYGAGPVRFLDFDDDYAFTFSDVSTPSRTHTDGYVWSADYSPSGTYSLSYGESKREVIVWDIQHRTPVKGFPLSDNRFSQNVEFLNDYSIVVIGNTGREVFQILMSSKGNAPQLRKILELPDRKDLSGNYVYGNITDVEVLEHSHLAIGLATGNVLYLDVTSVPHSSGDLPESAWDLVLEDEIGEEVESQVHLVYLKEPNQLVIHKNGMLYTYQLDGRLNTLFREPVMSQQFTFEITKMKAPAEGSMIGWMSSYDEVGVIEMSDEGLITRNSSESSTVYDVAVSPDKKYLAVGVSEDQIHMYRIEAMSASEVEWLETKLPLESLPEPDRNAIMRELNGHFDPESGFAEYFWNTISRQ